MGQCRREADLAQKARGAVAVGEAGLEHLDRNPARVPEIATEKDGREASASKLPLDGVTVAERGADLFHRNGHRATVSLSARLRQERWVFRARRSGSPPREPRAPRDRDPAWLSGATRWLGAPGAP